LAVGHIIETRPQAFYRRLAQLFSPTTAYSIIHLPAGIGNESQSLSRKMPALWPTSV